MSDKLSMLQELMMKIGGVPGLGFLQDMVFNAQATKKGFDMKVGDKKNQVSHLRDIGADAKKIVSKDPKKKAKK